jgi:hypothetical protein
MRTNIARLEQRLKRAEQMMPCGGPAPAELAFHRALETVPALRALVFEGIKILVSRPATVPMTDTEAVRLVELETEIERMAGELGLICPR